MKRYQPLVAAWHSLYKVTPEYVSSDLRLDQHNVVSWSACQHCGHTWDNTRHRSSTHLSRIQPFIFISRETISGLRLEWISTVWLVTGWTRTCWSLSRYTDVEMCLKVRPLHESLLSGVTGDCWCWSSIERNLSPSPLEWICKSHGDTALVTDVSFTIVILQPIKVQVDGCKCN